MTRLSKTLKMFSIIIIALCSMAFADDRGIVVKVLSGDSLIIETINGTRIPLRLAEIDAPNEGEFLFEESKEFLTDLLLGRTIYYTKEGQDNYGRTVSYVIFMKISVIHELIKNGLASTTDKFYFSPYTQALEREAINKKIGIWSKSTK